MKRLLIYILLIIITSCNNEHGKEKLINLFYKPNGNKILVNDINNIKKLNGFRNAKLGMLINKFDYSDWILLDTSFNIMSLQYNRKEFDSLFISNIEIKSITLTVINEKIQEIILDLDYNSQLEDILITAFGIPTEQSDSRDLEFLDNLKEKGLIINNGKKSNKSKKAAITVNALPFPTFTRWETDKITIDLINSQLKDEFTSKYKHSSTLKYKLNNTELLIDSLHSIAEGNLKIQTKNDLEQKTKEL